MKKIKLNFHRPSVGYGVFIKEGLLESATNFIDNIEKYESIIIFVDKNINKKYLSIISSQISSLKVNYNVIQVDLSKNSKSINLYLSMIKDLIKNKCYKDTLLLAVGGGSIGDSVGFVASTYYRGIDYINIPTTLLSMIDSSIGGKTSIDLDEGKNLIGSFYHPKNVLIDPKFLESISEKEYNSGLFEAIKYGLIYDKKLFDLIEDNINNNRDIVFINQLIDRCCSIKIQIVQQDEMDNNERMKLNFGHTIGHAIESLYNLRHGEAICYGMKCANYISKEMGTLSDENFDRINTLLNKINIPSIVADCDKIFDLIDRDKKIKLGKPNFILLNDIGNCYITSNINSSIIKQSIKNL